MDGVSISESFASLDLAAIYRFQFRRDDTIQKGQQFANDVGAGKQVFEVVGHASSERLCDFLMCDST